MKLIPQDVGLPGKFREYRPGQDDCAFALATGPKRFSLLSAPTGTGKSLIYMTVAKLLGARTLVLTGTKGLQAQLTSDFAAAGMADMRGLSNYPCVALSSGGPLAEFGRAGAGCDEGPCRIGVHCSLRTEGGCGYYDAQSSAREASMVVTNYSYWMTLSRHADPNAIGAFDLLVLDEAHAAPDWLAEFCAIELNRGKVKLLLGLDLPPIDEGVMVWAEWARGAALLASDRYTRARAELDRHVDRRTAARLLLELSQLGRDLGELAKAAKWKPADGMRREVVMPGTETDWVAESTSNGVKFSPVWAHAYAEPYLFRGIPKVVLASATLSATVATYLGIGVADMEYREVSSGFSPKRRPFVYIPTVRVDRRMNEGQARIWVNRIDRIIAARLDRKGIIHARSYDRAREIVSRSKHSGIMLSHTSSNLRDVVAKFKRAKAPCVLVSPSVEEGFDFPGDECRYQIIAKVPFLDMRSPVLKARAKSDSKYPNHVAAMALVQMVGRGVRSADDYAECFILDDHWAWFRRAAVFPKWFKQSWSQKTLPPPPVPLDGIDMAVRALRRSQVKDRR